MHLEKMMHFIATIIVGFVVGLLARALMPGKDPGGCLVTILLGVAGAVTGSYLGRSLGLYAEEQSAGFLMSVIGAMVLLFLYRLFSKRD
jgi:uncharacterized membrane protein YeaQ/YmgE (transglycosylase-associated protein family)